MPEPLLTTTGLRAGYGGKPVLQGVDLAVQPGEIVAVIGRNGVGKSTLMRSLVGLLPASAGGIAFRGAAVEGSPPTAAPASASVTCPRAATCSRA